VLQTAILYVCIFFFTLISYSVFFFLFLFYLFFIFSVIFFFFFLNFEVCFSRSDFGHDAPYYR